MLRRILSQQSAALLPRAAVTSIAARTYATEGVDLKDLIRQEKEAKRAAEAARLALKKKLEAERKAALKARQEKALARKAEKREKAVAYRARRAAALARRKELFAQRRAAMKIRKEKALARQAENREQVAAKRARRAAFIARRKELFAQRRAAMKIRKEKALASASARKAEEQTKSARAALLARPWKKQGKLSTSPSLLYVSEKMKTYVRPAGEKPFDALLRFRREYQTLSAEQKAPYEQKAAANRAARKDAKAKVKGVRASPYAIHFQENYEAVSKTVTETDRKKRIPEIGRLMAARWKSLSDAQKGEYKAKAAARKAAAEKAVEAMMKQ